MQEEMVEQEGFMTAATRRLAILGSIVAGVLGIVLALNAPLESQYTGAGVCLAATVMASGVAAYISQRRTPR